jgi:arylsulfatase A-like enzyme
MNESASTIAERFRAQGFRTEAITSAYLTSSKFFERGFDSFDGILASPWRWFSVAGLARKVSRFVPALDVPIERRAGSIVDDAVSRLRGSGPLFLWLHFFDPHTDYDPPPGFRDSLPATIPAPFDGHFMPLVKVSKGQMRPPSAAELAVLRKLYDGEVSYLDGQVGRLRREIEKAGLADRTSILFTADHGEAFAEHGVFLHTTAFQEVMHVPLIVWAPGRIRPGSRVEAVVRGIDVAPTLAELGGIRWSGPGEAVSVLSLLGDGEKVPRPARSDSDIQVMYGQPGEQTSSLLVWPWKLIYRQADRRVSLFNLEQDPAETRDVASTERRLADQLAETLSAGEAASHLDRRQSLDADTIRQLKSLGYIH